MFIEDVSSVARNDAEQLGIFLRCCHECVLMILALLLLVLRLEFHSFTL